VLMVTGGLAIGSGLGLTPCTIGLSMIHRAADGAVHGAAKIWDVVRH
jgi:hypothetical protein